MRLKVLAAGLLASAISLTASAGPFILAGTDADDHGSGSSTANFDGWLFMQKAIENIGAGVTNSSKTVTVLGSTSSALSAATSAFNFSSLASSGWTLQTISTGQFSSFFTSTGTFITTGVNASGILLMDSGNNVGGGVDGSAYVTYATTINNFIAGGGGLFSQANGYNWLGALGLSVVAVNESNTGITLTPAGNINFPGLTNGDLSAGPYHERFENVGSIAVLGTSQATGNAIIIGGASGSITDPGTGNTVPEPNSIALLGLGLLGILAMRKRKQQG